MKRIAALLFGVLVAVALAACGGDEPPSSEPTQPSLPLSTQQAAPLPSPESSEPAESEPAESVPAESDSAESESAESVPTESEPAESESVGGSEAGGEIELPKIEFD